MITERTRASSAHTPSVRSDRSEISTSSFISAPGLRPAPSSGGFARGAAGMSGSGRVESRKDLSAADKNEREEDKIKIRRLRIALRYFSKFTLSP